MFYNQVHFLQGKDRTILQLILLALPHFEPQATKYDHTHTHT